MYNKHDTSRLVYSTTFIFWAGMSAQATGNNCPTHSHPRVLFIVIRSIPRDDMLPPSSSTTWLYGSAIPRLALAPGCPSHGSRVLAGVPWPRAVDAPPRERGANAAAGWHRRLGSRSHGARATSRWCLSLCWTPRTRGGRILLPRARKQGQRKSAAAE